MTEQKTMYNGLAIAALVLGVFVFLWITSILAIVFGIIALRQINRSQGAQKGRGMAIAGIILGGFWIGVLFLLAAVFALGTTSGGGPALSCDTGCTKVRLRRQTVRGRSVYVGRERRRTSPANRTKIGMRLAAHNQRPNAE